LEEPHELHDVENMPTATKKLEFGGLKLSDTTLRALRAARFQAPTPIQAGAIPEVIAGVDVMVQSRTGSGKTAAYLLPIIEKLEECDAGCDPVALVLVPTRELAVQVRDEAVKLSVGREVRTAACYGGKPIAKQLMRLKEGVDIVVGTPGRLLDLMSRRALSNAKLRWVVLDEADRMLDIGFRPDIEKILRQTPNARQTLLFSATLPHPVMRLAERYMREPVSLDFSDSGIAVETIEQFYITIDRERKFDALVHLLDREQPRQAIIFCRTKRNADRTGRLLFNKMDDIATIHGGLTQPIRDKVMAQFRAGKLRYLVATDIVGRGIDVSGISHIINTMFTGSDEPGAWAAKGLRLHL
jgi:ATP-dependent RNA helicase DeaD